MSNKKADPGRRRVVIASLTVLTGAPLVQAVFYGRANAATLLRLAEDDPAAIALKYHKNAEDAPRVDRAGTPAAQQFCYNCSFIQADDGEWRPCQIFPSKAVSANGWCTAWSKKS